MREISDIDDNYYNYFKLPSKENQGHGLVTPTDGNHGRAVALGSIDATQLYICQRGLPEEIAAY